MEKKKSTLATVLLLIAVLIIGAMAGYIYMQKTEAEKIIGELETQKIEMQSQIDNLQGKIDAISNTIKDTQANNVNNVKIEGEYNSTGNENHGLTYKFSENTVIFSALYETKGIYEIVDNKINITYTEAYDPEGNSTDFYPNEQKEELIIVDENTLMSKKIIDGELYVGTYVKE